jgi:hypothetical protein
MKLILTTLAALAIGAGSLKADWFSDYNAETRQRHFENEQRDQNMRLMELERQQREQELQHMHRQLEQTVESRRGHRW